VGSGAQAPAEVEAVLFSDQFFEKLAPYPQNLLESTLTTATVYAIMEPVPVGTGSIFSPVRFSFLTVELGEETCLSRFAM
jgi:hypothetical protein